MLDLQPSWWLLLQGGLNFPGYFEMRVCARAESEAWRMDFKDPPFPCRWRQMSPGISLPPFRVFLLPPCSCYSIKRWRGR